MRHFSFNSDYSFVHFRTIGTYDFWSGAEVLSILEACAAVLQLPLKTVVDRFQDESEDGPAYLCLNPSEDRGITGIRDFIRSTERGSGDQFITRSHACVNLNTGRNLVITWVNSPSDEEDDLSPANAGLNDD